MPVPWDDLVDVLRSGQRFLLTSHVRPDCDALGSELGLAGILEALGKQVAIVNADATPANIAFIDPENRIQALGIDVTLGALPEHDVLVVVDTSAWVQLGDMANALKTSNATKIVIDHHVSSDDLGATQFKDTNCEATGRLIADLAGHLDVELTSKISTPLFAALVTDTGWLRFPSVTASSYEVAAKLVAGGADPPWVYGQLYEQDTLQRNLLLGRILSRLATLHKGRLAHTYVLNNDFEEIGALRTDTDDAVNQGLRIKGTETSLILVEQEAGGFKVSFRSRGPIDVSKVAEQFGGGGHKAASGAFINESFEKTQQAVVKAMSDALLGDEVDQH
jgi:phosphoesterase RecJ-like protein